MNELQIKVENFKIPEVVTFNYEELREVIIGSLENYKGLVYSEDQIKEAKKDKAKMNALKKAINDERISLERQYNEPFADFKAKCNDLIQIIDNVTKGIDSQVKVSEQKRKEEKYNALKQWYDFNGHPEWITFERVYDEKMLNASYKFEDAQAELKRIRDEHLYNIEELAKRCEFSVECCQLYRETFDMSQCWKMDARLREAKKQRDLIEATAKRDEAIREMDKPKPDPQISLDQINNDQVEIKPVRKIITFKIIATETQAHSMTMFMNTNNIKFKCIGVEELKNE